MKKLIILLLLGWYVQANAQYQTLFGRSHVSGGFVAPIVEIGINNQIPTSVGGGGGIVIGNGFIGGYGTGAVDFNKLFEDGDVEVVNIAHGGLWVGGSFPTYKLVHLYGSGRVGWGALDLQVHDNNGGFDGADNIFVFTPELGLEVNLTRWFRITGTAGYRLVDGANKARGYTNEDFSGWFTGLTFRFGWFGAHERW